MPLNLERFPPPEGLTLPGGISIVPASTAALPQRPTRNFFARLFSLSSVNFAFRLDPNGFLADLVRCLPLARLKRIRQLQTLTWARVGEGLPRYEGAPHLFDHNRLIHSLWAAVVRALQSKLLDIDGSDALVGILVEAIHDIFTPAGGDVMKVINPQLFDEDDMIGQLFRSKRYRAGWEEIRRKYALPSNTPERVAESLQGRGLDGELHEIADTWSYLANDIDALSRAYAQVRSPIPEYFGETIQSGYQRALNLWQKITVINGRVCIADQAALHDFLLLRIEFWRQLYQHPAHKIIERLQNRIILPPLFKHKKIVPEQLFLWDDGNLTTALSNLTGLVKTDSLLIGNVYPQLTEYASWNEGRLAECRAAHSGDLTLLGSFRGDQPIKPKTGKFFVATDDGIRSYEDACPSGAATIKALTVPPCAPVQLVTYPSTAERLPNALCRQWQQMRATWDIEPVYGKVA